MRKKDEIILNQHQQTRRTIFKKGRSFRKEILTDLCRAFPNMEFKQEDGQMPKPDKSTGIKFITRDEQQNEYEFKWDASPQFDISDTNSFQEEINLAIRCANEIALIINLQTKQEDME